jgi:uridylate kinase|tara:strand:+ start:357 stop:494 length:138 start_codon:yes stop_codon:yes gene_type:complete
MNHEKTTNHNNRSRVVVIIGAGTGVAYSSTAEALASKITKGKDAK